MKKQKTVSIKAKLLGVIIPVVIAIVVVLVVAAYQISAGTIKKYSQNLRSEERRVGKECRSRWSPYH